MRQIGVLLSIRYTIMEEAIFNFALIQPVIMSEFEARLFYSTTRGLVYTSLNITTQVKISIQNMLRRSNANDLF